MGVGEGNKEFVAEGSVTVGIITCYDYKKYN